MGDRSATARRLDAPGYLLGVAVRTALRAVATLLWKLVGRLRRETDIAWEDGEGNGPDQR